MKPGIQKRTNGDGSTRYRAQIRQRSFAPLTKTFTRLTDATRWVEDTKTAMRNSSLLFTEAHRTTLREALERHLSEPQINKKTGKPLKGWKRQKDRIKAWMNHSLALRYLSQLRGTDFSAYRDKRREEGMAENTIAIDLKVISKLFKIAAKDWGMEGLSNPIVSVTMPGPSNRRERRVRPEEENALMAHLAKRGAYLAPLAELAIETAMREGELLALTWADMDLQKRVAKLRDTKNSESRIVPLSTRAVAIIQALPRPLDMAASLFPISQDSVIRDFRKACTDAKIENLKFHDLRHEAVSRICNKLPMHEAMRVTGHKTPSMLMRYYHPKAEDLARKLA